MLVRQLFIFILVSLLLLACGAQETEIACPGAARCSIGKCILELEPDIQTIICDNTGCICYWDFAIINCPLISAFDEYAMQDLWRKGCCRAQ